MGKPKKSSNRPGGSLALTEVTVQMIRQCIARQELAALDMNFASNLIHRAWISPASIILAMIYLDKLKAKHSDFLRQNSSQDLFLISVAVASKFLFDKGEDEAVYNDDLAEIVNMEMSEINKTELEFLDAMEWSCYVNYESFREQLLKFEALVTMKELEKRRHNHSTYSEVLTIFEFFASNPKLNQLFHNLSDFTQSIVICLVSYCAAVAILTMSLTVVFTIHNSIHLHASHDENIALISITTNDNHCTPPANITIQQTSSNDKIFQIDFNAQNKKILRKLILDLDAFPTQNELLDNFGGHTSSILTIKPYRYVKQF